MGQFESSIGVKHVTVQALHTPVVQATAYIAGFVANHGFVRGVDASFQA
jgi:hypothetical protein